MKKGIFDEYSITLGTILYFFCLMGCGGNSDTVSRSLEPPQKSKRPTIEVLNGYQDISRSYFAFPIPTKISNRLLSLQNRLKQDPMINSNIDWCASTYFHITLVFSQDISALQSEQISKDLEKKLKNYPPMQMKLEPVPKVWPSVIVATLENRPELINLQKELVSIVKKYVPNYVDSLYAYVPHITLGYLKNRSSPNIQTDLSNRISLIDLNAKWNNVWVADRFELAQTVVPKTTSKVFVVYSL